MNTRPILFGAIAVAPMLLVVLLVSAFAVFGVESTMSAINPTPALIIAVVPLVLIGWFAFIHGEVVGTAPSAPA